MDLLNLKIKRDFDELFASSNGIPGIELNSEEIDEGVTPDTHVTMNGEETNSDLTKKPIIGCRICDKRIFKPLYYERHWKVSHKGVHPSQMYDNPVQCKICNRYLQNKQSLQSHVSAAHKKRRDIVGLGINQYAAPGEAPQRFCPLCGLVVNDYRGLKRHLEKIHGGLRVPPASAQTQQTPAIVSAPSTSSSTQVSPKPLTNRKALICATCGIACTDEKSLISHVLSLVCTMPSNNNEAQTSSLTTLLEPIQIANPNYTPEVVKVLEPFVMYPLERCDVKNMDQLPVFTSDHDKPRSINDENGAMRNPLLNGDEPFEIDSEFIGRRTNIPVIISNEQPIVPPSNADNGEHMNGEEMMVIEDGFKWYRCSICKFVAYNAASLKTHLIVYHKFKGCPVCDFAAQTANLVEHLKNVHSYKSNPVQNTEEEVNGNGNKELMSLLQRGKSNNSTNQSKQRRPLPVVCRVCGVKYSCCRDYRAHFLHRHSEYSPDEMFDNGWKCNQCSMIFQNLIGLRSHWVNQHKDTYSKEMFMNFAKQAIDDSKSALASCTSSEEKLSDESNSNSLAEIGSTSVCKVCHVPCVDKEQLLLHMSLVHGNRNNNDVESESTNSSGGVESAADLQTAKNSDSDFGEAHDLLSASVDLHAE